MRNYFKFVQMVQEEMSFNFFLESSIFSSDCHYVRIFLLVDLRGKIRLRVGETKKALKITS